MSNPLDKRLAVALAIENRTTGSGKINLGLSLFTDSRVMKVVRWRQEVQIVEV